MIMTCTLTSAETESNYNEQERYGVVRLACSCLVQAANNDRIVVRTVWELRGQPSLHVRQFLKRVRWKRDSFSLEMPSQNVHTKVCGFPVRCHFRGVAAK